jgi:hypothetical protein
MALGDVSHAGGVSVERSIEALEDEITTLAAQLSAATYHLLTLVAEFDRREGWGGFGMLSCAHWLNWKCGIGLVAAREKVRVARALVRLPRISAAMREGRVSYSKVRAMTRIATPANEGAVLAVALNGTAQHVERVARIYRRTGRVAENAQAVKQERERELVYFWDDDGCLVIKGRLPAERGAVVVKALQMAGEKLSLDADGKDDSAESWPARMGGPDEPFAAVRSRQLEGESAELNPWRARQADALVLVAEAALASGGRVGAASERQMVTVHVDAVALAKRDVHDHGECSDVSCHVHDGPAVAREVARRLACDSSVVAMTEGTRGEVLNVGRRTRVVSSALKRALERRDRGCRYPGCLNRRFVDAHHIEHWADGGATKLGNLVLLCRRHHRLVHEGGLSIELRGEDVSVRRADGRLIEQAPGTRAPADSAESLARGNAERGARIDARTGVPGWGGERADYVYIVAMIDEHDRQRSEPEAA